MQDLEYFLLRLNVHHRVRYSRDLREFLTGEKLDQASVDHLASYTKSIKGQFQRPKSNKLYSHIAAFAKTQAQGGSEVIPASLEAEYQSDLVEASKQLSLRVSKLKELLEVMATGFDKQAASLAKFGPIFTKLETVRDKQFDMSIDFELSQRSLSDIFALQHASTSLHSLVKNTAVLEIGFFDRYLRSIETQV